MKMIKVQGVRGSFANKIFYGSLRNDGTYLLLDEPLFGDHVLVELSSSGKIVFPLIGETDLFQTDLEPPKIQI